MRSNHTDSSRIERENLSPHDRDIMTATAAVRAEVPQGQYGRVGGEPRSRSVMSPKPAEEQAMQLTSNRRQIQLNLMLGDGRRRDITFQPDDLLYDENGVVRLISVVYNDGTVGNYKLLPNNESADERWRSSVTGWSRSG
jgi:hypothetical protein